MIEKNLHPKSCKRAKAFWVGYLKDITPRKYCQEYCVYREGAICNKRGE